jgi:hypothetical protein
MVGLLCILTVVRVVGLSPRLGVDLYQYSHLTSSASLWSEIQVVPKQSTAVPQSGLEAHSFSTFVAGRERTVVDSHQVGFSMGIVMHPIAAL